MPPLYRLTHHNGMLHDSQPSVLWLPQATHLNPAKMYLLLHKFRPASCRRASHSACSTAKSPQLTFSSIQFTLLTLGSKFFRPSVSSVGLSLRTSSALSDNRSPSPAQAMVLHRIRSQHCFLEPRV